MALLKIDFVTLDRPAFQFITTLNDVSLIFQFRFSYRSQAWFMNVLDENESPIIQGHKIVINWPLWRLYTDQRLPDGMLWCLGLSDNIEPTLENFGTEVILMYEEAA